MTRVRLVGTLRDWRNARDLWRLARRGQLPDNIERRYWDRTEYAKDAAELNTLGYTEVSTGEVDLCLHRPTVPPASNEVVDPLEWAVQRRLPSIHVHYTRQSPA